MDAQKIYTKALVTKVDKASGMFDVVASTGDVDRDGEVIDPKGWDVTNYKNNPVILFGHAWNELPIGIAENVTFDDKGLYITGRFASDEANPKAGHVRRLYEEGILRSVSVGFIPRERNGNVITKSELLELSFVPIPANPSARARALEKGLDVDLLDTPHEEVTPQAPAEPAPEQEPASPEPPVEPAPVQEPEVPAEQTEPAPEAEVKVGRVLSASNRSLISDAVSAMQSAVDALEALLEATDPEAGQPADGEDDPQTDSAKAKDPEMVQIPVAVIREIRATAIAEYQRNERIVTLAKRLLQSL